MRRGLIALLAAGVVLVAGFAAAAVASGGGPMDLLRAKPAKKGDRRPQAKPPASRAHVGSAPTGRSGAPAKSGEDEADNDDQDSKSGTSQEPAERKVMLCHHTGSWKHPFHAISVAEHAVTAHTAHGDSVGVCPATPADATPNKHEKQVAPKRPHPRNHGREMSTAARRLGKGQRPHGGGRSHSR
jgi:hypothetical protein